MKNELNKDANKELNILRNQIKSKNFYNKYLFYGPEEYLIEYYIDEMKNGMVSGAFSALNYSRIDGISNWNILEDYCRQMPVFSSRRMIVVRKPGIFKGGSKGEESGLRGRLLEILESLPESTCLVFWEEEIDRRLKILEPFKKEGLIVEFPFQQPSALAKWVVNVLKKSGKTIDIGTAAYLADISEPGMTNLYNEIEKLIVHSGERTVITMEDIQQICTKSVKSRIFDLTDALAGGQPGKALVILDELIFQKEPIPAILYMMAKHYRQLLEVKSLLLSGLSSREVISQLKIHPYAGGKLCKQSELLGIDSIKKALRLLLEADEAYKTGKMDPRVAVETVISRIAG